MGDKQRERMSDCPYSKHQTEKQKVSKSPLFGFRKPYREEKDGPLWCGCSIPNLRHKNIGDLDRGQAICMRCNHPWYH